MKKSTLIILTAFVFFAAAHAADVDFRRGFSSVAEIARPAVVFIQVEKNVPVRRGGYPFFNSPQEFFGHGQPGRGRQPQTYKQTGQGSGFLISKDGYILTNTHVVGDMDKITVKLVDGREYVAKRIGADTKTEVALIKIEGDDFPCLSIGDPEKLLIGEWVVAIGTPFGLEQTLTVGVVSAKGRSNIGITDYEDFIQTDAAINPGNSGGPLLNIDGEVIGMNTAIYSQSGGYMGIGFAVPIDMAMQVKGQLVANGRVTRGYIGIVMNPGEVTEQMAKSFGRNEGGGVLVADVQKGGPADKAGIKSGDIISELNGKKIKDSASFRMEVARIMPKEKANLVVFREGKAKKLTVTVEAFPDDEAGEAAPDSAAGEVQDKVGLQVQEVTRDLAQRFGYETEQGVMISEVMRGSPADEAGLQPGMLILEVNRKEVNSVKAFEQAIAKGKDGNVLLRVKTGQGTRFINLKTED
ncbi:MAG: Do family serine endopeptidase [Kiritimatiellaeota bacterium]|nr:Do family serine endopeptidase [Kiritimatiellota bacterium]